MHTIFPVVMLKSSLHLMNMHDSSSHAQYCPFCVISPGSNNKITLFIAFYVWYAWNNTILSIFHYINEVRVFYMHI